MKTEKPTFNISRKVYTQEGLDHDFVYANTTPLPSERILNAGYKGWKTVSSCSYWWTTLCQWMPIITWISTYKWKAWLPSDLIGGAIVGVLNVPQGMAYALLAGLPPVVGLYTSLFPSLIYCFLGTSRHMSIGTYAIISLMVRASIDKFACLPGIPADGGNFSDHGAPIALRILDEDNVTVGITYCYDKVHVAAALSCLSGIIMLCFGVLRMGFLANYLSEPIVQGVNCGAAFVVLNSQLPKLFGVSVANKDGPLALIYQLIDFLSRLHETNIVTLAMASISIALLVLFKDLINPIVQKKIKVPIPMELILVVSATACCHYLRLKDLYRVQTVPPIPRGISAPELPVAALFQDLFPDAIVLAIVTYSMAMSLSIMFANKHGYTIDPNQEWRAIGLANIFSSFFGCHNSGGSLTRSCVQDAQGCKSQLSSVTSMGMVLVVLLWLAQLLQDLPQCILAAMIVVALKNMFLQVTKLPPLWRNSKIDFFVWILSMTSVILLNVQYGLIIGVATALGIVIVRVQWPQSKELANLSRTEIYKAVGTYAKSLRSREIAVIRFDAPLIFANVETFKKKVQDVTSINPQTTREKLRKLMQKEAKRAQQRKISTVSNGSNRSNQSDSKYYVKVDEDPISHVIIDCSSILYVDIMGLNVLKEVWRDYETIDVKVFFAECKDGLRPMLDRSDFYSVVPKSHVFPTVHDACIVAIREWQMVASKSWKRKRLASLQTIDVHDISTDSEMETDHEDQEQDSSSQKWPSQTRPSVSS